MATAPSGMIASGAVRSNSRFHRFHQLPVQPRGDPDSAQLARRGVGSQCRQALRRIVDFGCARRDGDRRTHDIAIHNPGCIIASQRGAETSRLPAAAGAEGFLVPRRNDVQVSKALMLRCRIERRTESTFRKVSIDGDNPARRCPGAESESTLLTTIVRSISCRERSGTSPAANICETRSRNRSPQLERRGGRLRKPRPRLRQQMEGGRYVSLGNLSG